jgi:4-hydroxybenzoate polyprenyltransferase
MGENTEITTYAPAVSRGVLAYLKNIAMMIRVAHWAKNLFLFAPLFFAGRLFATDKLLEVFLGVVAFSLVASSIYILNDIKDIDKDRLHPVKQHRAIASGKITVSMAIFVMLICVVNGLAIGWVCGNKFLLVLVLYLLLNIGYSMGLKNMSILDIMILAAGFVLRIKAGGVIAQVGISQWLVIMVFLLALFLALGKRRDDLLVKESSGNEVRQAMSGYNLDFLNTSLAVVSAIMMMAYIMYTLSPEVIGHMGTYRLYYTSIFVFSGILRYLQLVYIYKDTRSPIRILYRDHFIQICIVLWGLSFYCLIYMKDLSFFLQ